MIYVVGPRGRLASTFCKLLLSERLGFTLLQTWEGFDMPKLSPKDCIINFAGRGVKSDERNSNKSAFSKVNVELPIYLANECYKAGSQLIHFASELESLDPNQDEYTRTKFEASQYILGLAKNGLQVACISLPSIVGFVERPGFIEKLILNSLIKGSISDSEIQFTRGMLHKNDFNAITYAVLENRWTSDSLITIENTTCISSSVFALCLQRGDGNGGEPVMSIDQSMNKEISFENSRIKMMAMTPTELMSLLINQTLHFGLK